MRILLIANENARRGAQSLDPVLEVFARAGHEVVRATATGGDDAPELIRHRAAGVDAIVLAGGDGTVHSAAEALVELDLPVGILPLGTANDLARAVAIPLDPVGAAETIVAGATRRIDVGEVNGTLFFNVAHVGLGAVLAEGLTGTMKRSLGPLAYTVASARMLRHLRPFRAEIAYGDERLAVRTISITVGNGRYFGGGGIVAEEAEIDDGLFHVFAVTTRNPVRLLWMLPSLLRGRQGRSGHVRSFAAEELDISTVRDMKVRADGKVVSMTPARFRMRRSAIAVFAPARAGEDPRPSP